MASKKRSYHFSFGNSSVGPIGYCAEVTARSKKEAVKFLQDSIPEHLGLDLDQREPGKVRGAGYVRIYFNADAITEADIDEVGDED